MLEMQIQIILMLEITCKMFGNAPVFGDTYLGVLFCLWEFIQGLK